MLSFEKPLNTINTGSATLIIRAKKAKLYAIKGDLTVANPRYYGGETAP